MSDDTFYYPPVEELTVKNLEIVRQLALDHPSYWLQSPYSSEVEALCMKWFSTSRAPASSGPIGGYTAPGQYVALESSIDMDSNTRFNMLYRESEILYTNLKAAGTGMVEISEKNAYFRTATSLLEKLISLQERALGIKQIHDFQQAVLDIMENVLSPDQRTSAMAQLKSAISGE